MYSSISPYSESKLRLITLILPQLSHLVNSSILGLIHLRFKTTSKYLPELRQRIVERWAASEIMVILPDVDEEMRFANLDDEHDRVLFVWWD